MYRTVRICVRELFYSGDNDGLRRVCRVFGAVAPGDVWPAGMVTLIVEPPGIETNLELYSSAFTLKVNVVSLASGEDSEAPKAIRTWP